MSEVRQAFEGFFDDVRDYVNTRVDLATFLATEKAAEVLSSLVTKGALILVFIIGFIFLNISLSLYVGTLINSAAVGFLIVAGFYILVGIILIVIKDTWLKNPILNSFIKQMHKRNDDDTNNA